MAGSRRFHIVALIAETRRDGRTKIAATLVADPVRHPSGVGQQAEGEIMDEISAVEDARITVRQGKVVQKSFGDHPWARIGDTPGIKSS